MLTTLLIILTILTIVIILLLAYLLRQSKSNTGTGQLMLQQQLSDLRTAIDTKLSESHKITQTQFGQSTQIIRDITERLTKLDNTNNQVIGFAGQLQKLQDMLQNPKQRGVFGEYFLETLLKNAFQPHQYQMQYKFKDGLIVDAALFMGDKIIPIDSKFSLENYNRIVEENDPRQKEQLEKAFKQDLKNRIDETAKYIRPEEKTLDFAFMFIPAEGIYYDLLVNRIGAIKVNTRDLIDYAIGEKHVHIVSPTTFYVTLQSVWQGMRAYHIQEQTKDILKNVGQLGKHLAAYEDYLKKLGGHLGTTVNMYNASYKEFAKVNKDVLKITGAEGTPTEMLQLQKPEVLDEA